MKPKTQTIRHIALRFIPVVGFFLFLIWIIVDADLGTQNFFVNFAHSIPLGDKIGHLCIFGSLTLLFNYALRCTTIQLFGFNVLKGSFGVLIFALVEEASQLFFPTRTFDTLDILSDIIGILMASILVERFNR